MLPCLELGLQEEFIVGFLEFYLLDVSSQFVGDKELELLSFVAIVVTDANALHVDSHHDVLSYSELGDFFVVFLQLLVEMEDIFTRIELELDSMNVFIDFSLILISHGLKKVFL